MAVAKKPKSNQNATTTTSNDHAAESFIAAASTTQAGEPEAPESKRVPVMIRFDPALLKLVDAAAKRRGISRSAWLQFTVSRALEQGEG
jgi:predicted HicB family RNase H-like nuclease